MTRLEICLPNQLLYMYIINKQSVAKWEVFGCVVFKSKRFNVILSTFYLIPYSQITSALVSSFIWSIFPFFVINLSIPIWQIQRDATTFWSLVTIDMIVSHKLLSWMCLHPFDTHKAYHIFSIFDDNRDMIILVNTTNVRKDQKTQMPNLLIVVKIAKCVTNNQNTAMTGCR